MLQFGLDQQSEAVALIRYKQSYNVFIQSINFMLENHREIYVLFILFFICFWWSRDIVVVFTDLIVQNGLLQWR